MSELPQSIESTIELSAILIDQGQIQIKLTPPPCVKRSAVSVCFVIDISQRYLKELERDNLFTDSSFEEVLAQSIKSLLFALSERDTVSFVVSQDNLETESNLKQLKPVSMTPEGKQQVSSWLEDLTLNRNNSTVEAIEAAVDIHEEQLKTSSIPLEPAIVLISDLREKSEDDQILVRQKIINQIKTKVQSTGYLQESLSIHSVCVSNNANAYLFLEVAKQFCGQFSYLDNPSTPQKSLAPLFSNILTTFVSKFNIQIKLQSPQITFAPFNSCSQLIQHSFSHDFKEITIHSGSLRYEQSRFIVLKLSNIEQMTKDNSTFMSIKMSFTLPDILRNAFISKKQTYDITSFQLTSQNSEDDIIQAKVQAIRHQFVELLLANTKKYQFGIQSYALSSLAQLQEILDKSASESSYGSLLSILLKFLRENAFTSNQKFTASRSNILALIHSHSLQQQTIFDDSLEVFAKKRYTHYLDKIQQQTENCNSPVPSPKKRREHSPKDQGCIRIKEFEMYEIYECSRF